MLLSIKEIRICINPKDEVDDACQQDLSKKNICKSKFRNL